MNHHILILAVASALFVCTCASVAQEGRALTLEESLAGKPPWRRLFLDAMVIEESEGLDRVFHAAEKYPANPVLPKEKAWEGWGPYIYGTVLWDEGKLRMWYQVIAQEDRLRTRALYAESEDGIRWSRPDLGLVDWQGSTSNNIFAEGTCSIPSVIVRPEAPDDERYAMYCFGGEAGAHVGFSSDGIRYSSDKPEYQKLFSTSDVINIFRDPYESRYVATYKTPNRRHRAVGIALSEDGIKWDKPIQGAAFGADDLDPDATQVYGMPVFPYQGMYIGLPWIYHARWIKYGKYESPNVMYEAQEGSPKTVDVQMAWSWDLISWTRPPAREPFIALGDDGAFDSKAIYTARSPVIVNNKLFFYYGGFDKVHDDYDDVNGAIGLATLRLDGFCSMRAGGEEGWFISRREVFRTPAVTINAKTAPGGYVTAELVDRNNKVIKGFSRDDCIPFTGDSIGHSLAWKTKEFPEDARDADKKVRFILKNADIYSYLPQDIDQKRDTGRHDL